MISIFSIIFNYLSLKITEIWGFKNPKKQSKTLKNAYFRDRLEKYSELGGCLKLKIFKISFFENAKKINPLTLVLFEIRPFLWSGQGGLKSTFSKFWEEECEMVRGCNIRVRGVIEMGKQAKFEKAITSTFGVMKIIWSKNKVLRQK